MRFVPYAALAAVSNSGTKTSAAIDASQLLAGSVVATFTDGTAAGTLKLQAADDASSPSNWVDIPNTSQSVSSGDTTLIPKTELCYRWVRVVWTQSGGAGTMTANFMGLGF